jgi:peptide-methionine (S)-S-oxide reductase
MSSWPRLIIILAVLNISFTSFFTSLLLAQSSSEGNGPMSADVGSFSSADRKLETATLGGGCFWCVEAVFQRVDGVTAVVSGYAGGSVPNPTYDAVRTGGTGHAEVCQVTFDPSIVSFEQILLVFFKTHDPTSLNKQGLDIGTQYRSVIFYHDEEQRLVAEEVIDEIKDEKAFRKRKIVTEISPLPDFHVAEQYHQNYFRLHPEAFYCQSTIVPKIEKFEKNFKEQSRLQKERESKRKKK